MCNRLNVIAFLKTQILRLSTFKSYVLSVKHLVVAAIIEVAVLVIIAVVTVAAAKVTVKCKAIILQTWTGPAGSRRLRLPDFKTVGT